MQHFATIAEQRRYSREERRSGRSVVLVPTMGALHDGHMSLVALAKEKGQRVVVSIFVNPLQFDRPDDLAAYPQTLAADLAMLAAAGVDAVFTPAVGELYPQGFATFVEVVGPLTDKLCAAARPGHFRGVATVVCKLLHIVEPDVAVFGEKDLQQVLIISTMIRDLDLPVEVVVGPTVREADGLPMSSRNRRLTASGRTKALALPRGLELANQAFKAGTRASVALMEHVYNELLIHDGVEVDYCDVIALKGFAEVETAEAGSILAAAAFVDGVRLIDHIQLGGPALQVALDEAGH
jgi:pantoate--beta-alanine ligase